MPTAEKLSSAKPGASPAVAWAAAGLAAVLAVGALLVSSCGTVEQAVQTPLTVPGASFVGNAACTDCHAHFVRQFPSSPHGRRHREDGLRMAGHTGCESCHGPGSLHIQGGGGVGKSILNPGKDPAACYGCHLEVHAEFSLPQHHPVPEGQMSCVDCHDPHGFDIAKPRGGLAMARLNESCAGCHREQGRPFVFEHEAMREGCGVCHQAHGSVNEKLIPQRDANLCLKCHAQINAPGVVSIGKVDHFRSLSQGTCWSAGCHTAVHGSNVNPKMLY